jgi:hypothetical protein
MPRERCQYVGEMRDRFEIGLNPVDKHRATDEEKASLTEAQVCCKDGSCLLMARLAVHTFNLCSLLVSDWIFCLHQGELHLPTSHLQKL